MMRWFWVIHNDNTVDDPLVTEAHDLPLSDTSALFQGRPIDSWSDSAILRVIDPKNDGDPDDALQNHLNLIVASPRLRRALEDTGVKGGQFLPVDVLNSRNECLTGLSILNVVDLAPCSRHPIFRL